MSATRTVPKHVKGEPAWDIAQLFPEQGYWDEDEYLALPGNRLVEFADGLVEVLPMPTMTHQLIVLILYRLISAFVEPLSLGRVLVAPLRVRLRPGKYREPDLVFMLARHASRMGERFWRGADLVMEVVSDDPEDRRRDLVTKRGEYARARIPEYWIVDPRKSQITVLRQAGGKYAVHGQYRRGSLARSALLKGFEVNVDAVFSAR